LILEPENIEETYNYESLLLDIASLHGLRGGNIIDTFTNDHMKDLRTHEMSDQELIFMISFSE